MVNIMGIFNKAQSPAEGIVLDRKFDDCIFYTVKCQCGNVDDDIEFSVELDTDTNEIIVHTYLRSKTDYYSEVFESYGCKLKNQWLCDIRYWVVSFINGLMRRIKITKDVWLHGYTWYYTTTVMNEQTALNYAEAIKNSVKMLKKKI